MFIKQVLILAAGEGKRMMPLTKNTPKPLVKVYGKSMLDRILEKLESIPDVQKIVVNGYYLSDKIEEHLIKINNPKIIFSKEKIKLETGGGLIQAMKFLDNNEPVLIINGDIIWEDIDVLNHLIKSYDELNCDILLGLKQKDKFFGYDGGGDFNLSKNGKIEKNKVNEYAYIGIQILHPKILKKIILPKIPFSLNNFFRNQDVSLKAVKLPGDFFHIGSKENLEKFEEKFYGYKK